MFQLNHNNRNLLVMLLLLTGAFVFWAGSSRVSSAWQENNAAANSATTGAATEAPNLPAVEKKQSGGMKIMGSKSPWQILVDGGPLMIPIALSSILLFVFVFERFLSLRVSRIIPGPFVERLLQQIKDGQIDRDVAIRLCEENKSPVSQVIGAALTRWNRPSVEVEQAVLDSGERVANELRKYLRLINGISTVSPLLGLLGTVTGMIAAFDAIGNATGSRPELQIAGGIAEALITTAAGLSVAIPALIAYLFFVGRIDYLIMRIDSIGQRVVTLIASDAYRAPYESKSSGDGVDGELGNKKKKRAA